MEQTFTVWFRLFLSLTGNPENQPIKENIHKLSINVFKYIQNLAPTSCGFFVDLTLQSTVYCQT